MDIYVVVYNALATNKSSIVRLPVSVDAGFDVTNMNSNETIVTNQHPTPSFLNTSSSAAEYALVFNTGPLEPIGGTVFRVRRAAGGSSRSYGASLKALSSTELQRLRGLRAKGEKEKNLSNKITASNGKFSAQFDR